MLFYKIDNLKINLNEKKLFRFSDKKQSFFSEINFHFYILPFFVSYNHGTKTAYKCKRFSRWSF